MANDEADVVYVVARRGNGGRNHVHTDPECVHVQRATTVFEKPRATADLDKLCQVCTGAWSRPGTDPGTDPNATRKLLANTAPEDLGLSAIGERTTGGDDGE